MKYFHTESLFFQVGVSLREIAFGAIKFETFNPRPGMGFRITRPGRGAESAPRPANSAPMKARITKCLW